MIVDYFKCAEFGGDVPFSALNGKYSFWANLVQKIKIAHST